MASLSLRTLNARTERRHERKLRTTDALMSYDVRSVYKPFLANRRDQYLYVLEKLTFYVDTQTFELRCFEIGNSLSANLVIHKQRRGKRLYWVCPLTGQKASILYLVDTGAEMLLGSRKALGLCYPSQALHRTPAYDGAVYVGYLKTSLPVYLRVASRRQQRHWKGLRRLAREFS